MVFDQVESLVKRDKRLKNVEWEVIGGETTMMPFEFWEEMLPFTLKRIEDINKLCEKKGSLNFLTNLIYKDKRYTDLFNQYGHHELFCLYTSWEPDTNRFGNNDKLLPKFKETLKSISANEKILDIILTKTVCEMNPEEIIEEFGALGITDYSIKQLSPYGSGKQFFKDHMVSFDKMADFLERFHRSRNRGVVTYTPMDEMHGALSDGTAFQCNGNFKYDLSIEPDGLTHFNANQTKSDMVGGFKPIYINDPDWATRVLFENTTEETNKLTLKHRECIQCEYLRFCNAGWYHYKLLPDDEYRRLAHSECSGFKRIWDIAKEAGYHFNLTQNNHISAIQNASIAPFRVKDVIVHEKLIEGYEEYISAIQSAEHIEVTDSVMFDKTPLQRMMAYESLGCTYTIPRLNLINPDLDMVNHIVSGVLPNAEYSQVELWSVITSNKWNPDMQVILGCYNQLVRMLGGVEEALNTGICIYIDRRNEEIFKTLIMWHFCDRVEGIYISDSGTESQNYLGELIRMTFVENTLLQSYKNTCI
ncbi:hypothetical protein OTK49_02060 [Vibrio coralliirubri]|uniref:hypothetical protein n=1 Tax=Vibrio coralliirubri TaxID=1516159 RepID=UPI0022842317|nr:hypothetical protein [Vibrio coralliirubri]MCY9861299.1 hypothetical protein [Vibrio coralliirubri]